MTRNFRGKRLVYYAFGSGWGVLRRANSVSNTFGIETYAATLTGNPIARDRFIGYGLNPVIAPPCIEDKPDDMLRFVQESIDEIQPEYLFIDSFYAGIAGELDHLKTDARKVYLARDVSVYFDMHKRKDDGEWLCFDEMLPVDGCEMIDLIPNRLVAVSSSAIKQMARGGSVAFHTGLPKEMDGSGSTLMSMQNGDMMVLCETKYFYSHDATVSVAPTCNAVNETKGCRAKINWVPVKRKYDDHWKRLEAIKRLRG